MADKANKRTVAIGRHLSQLKRQRQNEKLRLANQAVRGAMKGSIKKVVEAVQKKDKAAAQANLKSATSMLHKAAAKSIVHKKNASRNIARLAKSVSSL